MKKLKFPVTPGKLWADYEVQKWLDGQQEESAVDAVAPKKIRFIDSYAGAEVWADGRKITMVMTKAEFHSTPVPGTKLVQASQYCLDEIAAHMQQGGEQ